MLTIIIPKILAHEVYVLNKTLVTSDETNHSINIWHALNSGRTWLLFIACALTIGSLFALALYLKSRPYFKKLGHQIDKSAILAPDIIRIAFGASLLFSASHGALYGPELPLHSIIGGNLILALLWVSGTGLVLGLWSRIWALLMMLVWLWALVTKGVYLFTYGNYLGEALAVFLLPCQRMSIDYFITNKEKSKSIMRWSHFSMPVARILFGASLLYTAVSVKFMDTALSLDVVNHYHLTNYFPFAPLFVVLGAGLIEVLVSLLYMTGLLQRFTTVIFLVFMTLSLLFFKESVWPHYLLIALAIGIFMHKPDMWAADRYLFAKQSKPGKRERRQQQA